MFLCCLTWLKRCIASVDAILSGGAGCGGFRRHITVAQMQEALSALDRIGELLDRDHFIYQTIIDALNKRMNTTIELSFSDPHIFDVFTIEFLTACIGNDDWVDPRDVEAHFQPNRAREGLIQKMREKGSGDEQRSTDLKNPIELYLQTVSVMAK